MTEKLLAAVDANEAGESTDSKAASDQAQDGGPSDVRKFSWPGLFLRMTDFGFHPFLFKHLVESNNNNNNLGH